ncbi:hypothetical protein KLP28_05985 [Nocardioidaceae bacterium]|nr:hypothetical protein KLP28_05985 [Nocardioidaceae bacterium]
MADQPNAKTRSSWRVGVVGAGLGAVVVGAFVWWGHGTGPQEIDGVVLVRDDRSLATEAIAGFGWSAPIVLLEDRCVGFESDDGSTLAVFPPGAQLSVRGGGVVVTHDDERFALGRTYDFQAHIMPVPAGVPDECAAADAVRLD